MAKWFDQAREIERLRAEVTRQRSVIDRLTAQLGVSSDEVDAFGVSDDERALARDGKSIEAIKRYRERTGADLVTAKRAIDSVTH